MDEKTKPARWQVHRFHDKVALWTGTGGTVYLNVTEAQLIGDALQEAASDIRVRPDFLKSQFKMTGSAD